MYKKIFRHKFYFLTDSLTPTPPPAPPLPLNGRNLLGVTSFLSMLPYLEVSSTHNTVHLSWDNKNQQPKCCQEEVRPHQKVKTPKIQR